MPQYLHSSQVKSPLRYPGGKQKAIQKLALYLPRNMGEYREPFAGGASMFFHIRQALPDISCWLNDLNTELYYFWEQAKVNLDELVDGVQQLKRDSANGKRLFTDLVNADVDSMSALERATRFFVLNRITFSGTIESGGYSEEAFKKRFTNSSIDRLAILRGIFNKTDITNLEYSELLSTPGDNVFII